MESRADDATPWAQGVALTRQSWYDFSSTNVSAPMAPTASAL
jgi:hypothetical protein